MISKMGKTSILVWVLWASAGGASRLPRSTTLQSTQTRATRGRGTLSLMVSSSSRGTCAWGLIGDVGQRVKKIHGGEACCLTKCLVAKTSKMAAVFVEKLVGFGEGCGVQARLADPADRPPRAIPGLFPTTEGRLHLFQGLQIFLQPIDMLLHFRNGGPQFGHRADGAPP